MGFKIREEHGPELDHLWYHGFCYYDFSRNKVISYVIPLNLLIWILRSIWILLRFPPVSDYSGHIYDEAYKKGYWDGYDQAEKESILAKELKRAINGKD